MPTRTQWAVAIVGVVVLSAVIVALGQGSIPEPTPSQPAKEPDPSSTPSTPPREDAPLSTPAIEQPPTDPSA